MIRRCYRCGKVFGEKEPFEDKSETHGLDPECFVSEMNDIEEKLCKLREAGWLPYDADQRP